MTLAEMVIQLRWLLEEPDSSNTKWTTTTIDSGISATDLLKKHLNHAHRQISFARPWPFLESFSTIVTSPSREPSTGTNTADASTSTTQVVDSALDSSVDDYYNGYLLVNTTRDAVARISDYDGGTTTITLATPIPSQAVGDSYYIVRDRFFIPPSCRQLYSVRNLSKPQKIVVRGAHKVDIQHPRYATAGPPNMAVLFGLDQTRYPATGTLAMDATSSTTSIVDAALPVTTDDYYNNWMVVNTTRDRHARVTDYNGTTKTLTVSPAIASQTDTDTYFLVRGLMTVQFYPPPDTTYTLELRYYRHVAPLINDHDVPEMGMYVPGSEDAIVYGAAALAYIQDGRPEKAVHMKQLQNDLLQMLGAIEYRDTDTLDTLDPAVPGYNIDYEFSSIGGG